MGAHGGVVGRERYEVDGGLIMLVVLWGSARVAKEGTLSICEIEEKGCRI